MEGEAVLERRHVVVPFAAGVVGGVNTDTQVSAQHQHADVVAQSHTGTQGDVLEEGSAVQLATGTVGVPFQQPDVAGIDKGGAVQVAPDGESVFEVGFEFKGTRLVEVAVYFVLGRQLAAGAERAYGEGAYAVGSADVELFAVRHLFGVAVGVLGTHEHTAYQPVVGAEAMVVDHLGTSLDKLGEAAAEDAFLAVLSQQ